MKAKKIISVFLILIFTGCFWVTAFAADQPLFLPDNGGTYVNPPSVIGGQGNTYYSGNTQSVFGSSGDTLIGGPLDSASTGGFVPPVTQAASIAPEITKHPGSEDKKTGESTSFIARAYPYDSVYWMAIDPNGEHVAVDSIGDKITGVTFTGTHSEQLFINNVTDAINGWKFYAVFSNNFGTTITGEAEVRVPAEPTPTPMPTPTPTPEPTPTPTLAPTPTAVLPTSGGSGTGSSSSGSGSSGGSMLGSGAVMPTSGQSSSGNADASSTPYTSLTGSSGSGITNTSANQGRSYTGAYILAAAAAAVIIGAIAVMALYMRGKISLGKFEQILGGEQSSDNNGDGDEFYNPDDFKDT